MERSTKSKIATMLAATALMAMAGSGGAVAGALITGKDIQDGSVKARDLAANSVTSREIDNTQVQMTDLSGDVRQRLAGAANSATVQYVTVTVSTDSEAMVYEAAACPAGTQPVTSFMLQGSAGYSSGQEYIDPQQNAVMVQIDDYSSPGDGVPASREIQVVCLN